MISREPTLEEIEDYNGKESKEKRATVIVVIMICLAVGAVYTLIKANYNSVSDYIGKETSYSTTFPQKN